MSGVTGEISGVGLAYVTRAIDGDIKTTKTAFDKKLGENVTKETTVEEPVIVFFSSGTSQVMSLKRAEALGYLEQPEVMNLANVQDTKTPAGRYKNAIREKDRLDAWMALENAVIQRCVGKSGHPLPLDCTYSENSIYFDAQHEEIAA